MPIFPNTLSQRILKANFTGTMWLSQHLSIKNGLRIGLYELAIRLRLFDKNFDGYIDKREFRWMTSSKLFNKKTIDIVFEVNHILVLSLFNEIKRDAMLMGMVNWIFKSSRR